jgi:hypothetical protein
LTSHRQLEEVHLYGEYIKKFCPIVKTFDLLFHINKIDIDISKVGNYFQSLPFENKTLILTSKNAGYTFGGIEAVADCFDLLKDYDYVIHSHPDVFLTKDDIIGKILEYFSYSDKVFIVNKSWGADHKWMSFDFFIFKPRLLTVNIFFAELYTYTDSPEHYLYHVIKKYNVKYQVVKRFDNDNWSPRRIDDHLKLYHLNQK